MTTVTWCSAGILFGGRGGWRHPVDSAAREKRRGSTGGKAARSYNELCQLDTWSNLANCRTSPEARMHVGR